MKRWILPIAAGIAMPVLAAYAHHSISGVYDSSRQVTIEGIITQFHFINPHPFVVMETRNSSGAQQWRLEMDNRSELVEVGMNSETLKPGDRIVVSGSPGRTQSQSYEQGGSSPRISVISR